MHRYLVIKKNFSFNLRAEFWSLFGIPGISSALRKAYRVPQGITGAVSGMLTYCIALKGVWLWPLPMTKELTRYFNIAATVQVCSGQIPVYMVVNRVPVL